ncbi:hypothetical protein ACFW23_13130 [Streptomyces rochei]|uniref:hypothetical protein n=1 Tax=Streptomyces rochei TaxID=1928 RepID=UPI0036A965E9
MRWQTKFLAGTLAPVITLVLTSTSAQAFGGGGTKDETSGSTDGKGSLSSSVSSIRITYVSGGDGGGEQGLGP